MTPPPNAERPGGRPEPEWIAKLREEVVCSKMTHNFTFTRNEVIELLGGVDAVLYPKTPASAASVGGDSVKALIHALNLKDHASDPELMVGMFHDGVIGRDVLEAAASALASRPAPAVIPVALTWQYFTRSSLNGRTVWADCDDEEAAKAMQREGFDIRCITVHGPAAPTHPESVSAEPSCSTHPDAPHGFDRNASHNADRYVCECEGWAPEAAVSVGMVGHVRGYVSGREAAASFYPSSRSPSSQPRAREDQGLSSGLATPPRSLRSMTRPALLLSLLLAITFTAGWMVPRPPPKPVSMRPENRVEAARRIEAMREHQIQSDPFQPDGAVIFLGNSITAGLAVDAVADRAVNYGIGGQSCAQLLAALPQYGSLRRARLVVLAIGTVDVVIREPDLEECLQALGDAIPGPLLWNAIPPTTKADVSGANETIRELCEARPRCTYLEAPITQADLLPDGVHLAPSGYVKWLRALQAATASGGAPSGV